MQEHEPNPALNHTTLVAMPQSGEVYITADEAGEYYIRGPEGADIDRPLTEPEVIEAIEVHSYAFYGKSFDTPEALEEFRQEEAGRFAEKHGLSLSLIDTSEYDEVDVRGLIEAAQRLSKTESPDFTFGLLTKILDFPIVQRTPELQAEVSQKIEDLSA